MTERVLITAALPYANGLLHFGHLAGAYLPADCYARFERLRGKDVLFISGSDEYGVAITLNAEKEGISPVDYVEKYHQLHKDFFQKVNIHFDHFSRTTTSFHPPVVIDFFKNLHEAGFIQAQEDEHLFSEEENRFLADRYVMGTCPLCGFPEARGDECTDCGASYDSIDLKNPVSKITGNPLTKKKSVHWFLRLDLFKDFLLSMVKEKKWKVNVENFALSFAQDLKPRAITRDLEWGIPVPLEEAKGKVFYVWFDAPIGYISATKEWASLNNAPDKWKDYWHDLSTRYVQFIGKDNIPFHALFFPAMLKGQKLSYKIVDDLVANEFYKFSGQQFSKSATNQSIDCNAIISHFHVDQIRYMLAAGAPETSDSEFTFKEFQMRCNAELVGKFGNFINRVLSFAKKNGFKKFSLDSGLDARDRIFIDLITGLVKKAETAYAEYSLRRAMAALMEIAQSGNAYFDSTAPWKAIKDSDKHNQVVKILSCCLVCQQIMAFVAAPVMPETAEKIFNMIGSSDSIKNIKWSEMIEHALKHEYSIAEVNILFQRVEEEELINL
ncbi:methionine--tRNA ligase [Candidatus Clavichlamydia salmonicola]|uniref:methionine--tRNA ligase n=1 Tax=Candidatus Clavichlamydia salmonicola TaxID=469812 RepID=UPI001890F7AA|nr:methionine--tRNA ligase [Candidatus Clavichlamydia salmonicola]